MEKLELKKSKMGGIKGGRSTTEFTQTGVAEIEQELDKDGKPIGKPILVEMPL